MGLPSICPHHFWHQFNLLASPLSFGDELGSWAAWRASCRWSWISGLLIESDRLGATEGLRHEIIACTGAYLSHLRRVVTLMEKVSGSSVMLIGTLAFPFRGSHLTILSWKLLAFCVKVQASSWIILFSWFLAPVFLERCLRFQHFIARKTLMNCSKWRRKWDDWWVTGLRQIRKN